MLIGVALAALTGCERESAQSMKSGAAQMAPTMDMRGDINEMRANVEAAKRNPSIADKSKAGPPIHLNPYVVSPPKAHHHEMESAKKAQDAKRH
jgi:hypothetical protein